MNKGLLIDWQMSGALLAVANSDDQAAFFKSFVREMRTWPTRHQQETQLAEVNLALTDDEKDCLAMLGYRNAT